MFNIPKLEVCCCCDELKECRALEDPYITEAIFEHDPGDEDSWGYWCDECYQKQVDSI